nr:MAG TPA: hypothetical protein [Caudoviricetes sp.]
MPCDISIVYHQIGQNVSKYLTKGSFFGCLFFLSYPKINNASGHILQNLRKTVNKL